MTWRSIEASPARPSALSRELRVVAAREHGVGPEQLRWIGVDPELFEAFYREHVDGLQRFVARRVGDRERAADLTAEIFLAAIESADRYRPGRGTPKAWLYGIARVLVADDRRRPGRERPGGSASAAAPCSTPTTPRGSTRGSTPPPSRAASTRRWSGFPKPSGRCWSWSPSTS